jgi:hypothetical protein
MYRYIPVRTSVKFSYCLIRCCTGTYWYVPVCTILPNPVQVYRIPDDTMIQGISMDIIVPWICRSATVTECIYTVYPWIIYHVYRPCIYLVYPWIHMVYHLTYIHGIYVVYPSPWIFLAFYNQISRPPGQCCWSHSMRTRVWVIKSVLFHAPRWK